LSSKQADFKAYNPEEYRRHASAPRDVANAGASAQVASAAFVRSVIAARTRNPCPAKPFK
jgi:hypothetical protein